MTFGQHPQEDMCLPSGYAPGYGIAGTSTLVVPNMHSSWGAGTSQVPQGVRGL